MAKSIADAISTELFSGRKYGWIYEERGEERQGTNSKLTSVEKNEQEKDKFGQLGAQELNYCDSQDSTIRRLHRQLLKPRSNSVPKSCIKTAVI